MSKNIEMDNKSIKVSVVVPVYNAEQYLIRCMDSLFSQTLKEIEFILVDDGSTDRSSMMCDEYEKTDERVKVIHLSNGGPARARNYGMKLAKGEYIGFVDSDDYIETNMFEKLYGAVKQEDSDIAMCGYLISDGSCVRKIELKYKEKYEGNIIIKNELLRRYYTGENQGLSSLWNKLFKKSFVEYEQLRIDEKLHRAEDAWFVFDSLKKAESFVFVPDSLYYYVQNTNSIMHSLLPEQYELWVDNKKRAIKENEQLKFEIDAQKFYGDFLYKTAVYCRELMIRHNSKKVRDILKDDFYRKHAIYTRALPKHIQLLHFTGRYVPELALLFYGIWAHMGSKGRNAE